MIKLNIQEAKTHLSCYLAQLEKEKRFALQAQCFRSRKIRPIANKPRKPRPIRLAKGKVKIDPSFFDPLPEEIIAAFEGHSG